MIEVTPLSDHEIKTSIAKIIHKRMPGARVILFGSRATGNYSERSDYDVAVNAGERLPVEVYFDIIDELNRLDTLKRIDFSDYYEMDEFFRKIVDREGVELDDR